MFPIGQALQDAARSSDAPDAHHSGLRSGASSCLMKNLVYFSKILFTFSDAIPLNRILQLARSCNTAGQKIGSMVAKPHCF